MAIKEIKRYETKEDRDEFLKEMNVMANLMHPNIIRLFGIVEQGIMLQLSALYASQKFLI